MTQTMTALFDTRPEAMTAIDELVAAGIPRTAIRIMPETDASTTTETRSSYDTTRDEKGFWASLGDMFMPDEDRHTYSEALHRGSIMVSVSAEDAMAHRAEDILEKHGTVNLDERETTWRKDGWAGYSAPVADVGSTAAVASTGTAAKSTGLATEGRTDDLGAERLEEVEERLQVGKRQVGSGRVKVRSYVVETPVSEQVNLRSESVHVERRPVDRIVTGGVDAFRDRTIEATATSEEAVVSKEAHVTGEVLLKKEVGQRTETITDKVRSTKVEVEDDSKAGLAPANRV